MEAEDFMSSATLVSAEEYLATSYRPDRELLDGELVERNVGEYDHSNLQTALSTRLRIRQREWNVRVLAEQRIQVVPGRFRVPDICIISRDRELERVFTRPPIVCIEILSKDDSLRSMQERVDDYLNFGVPNIWILDPVQLRAYLCSRKGFQEPEGGMLEVPSSPIQIRLEDVFADLD
jgi:Uma2 family endonuclease